MNIPKIYYPSHSYLEDLRGETDRMSANEYDFYLNMEDHDINKEPITESQSTYLGILWEKYCG